MDFADKIVTKIPLESIWNEEKELQFERQKYLNRELLKNMLQAGRPIQFIVASGGEKLNWIPLDKCFETYKKDFKDHVIDDLKRIDLDNFNDNFGFIASVWTDNTNNEVIVLEHVH